MFRTLKKRLFGGVSRGARATQAAPVASVAEARLANWNLRANVANGAASKLAEQLAGPNLVLPWLFSLLGVPIWMFGLLLPIKQSCSLLPQLLVAGQIRRLAVRKWVWVCSGLVQAVCLLLMIPAALWLSPVGAGFAVLGLLLLFCLASGTASVAFQEVLGKTIARGSRGQLLARRAFAGGILTLLAGLLLNRWWEQRPSLAAVLWLLLGAALLWLLAALLFAVLREPDGAVNNGRNSLAEARAGFDYYRRYPGFRRFLLARSLLLTVEMAPPFFVLHAGQLLGLQVKDLGLLLAAVGFSQVISAPFWGRMADRTSAQVLTRSAQIAAAATLLAVLLPALPLSFLQHAGYLLVFILIGLAEAGVRLGRKTYLLDATSEGERATCNAFSNSLVGAVALLGGLAGLVAQWLGVTALLVVLGVLTLAAVGVCRSLPEAQQMLESPKPGSA